MFRKQLPGQTAQPLAFLWLAQQREELRAEGFSGHHPEGPAPLKDADDLTEIKSMRPHQNCSDMLRRLKDVMTAGWDQAAAHKRDVSQLIDGGKLAYAIEQEDAAADLLRR